MVYKILFIEAILIAGLLYLKFAPEASPSGDVAAEEVEQAPSPKAADVAVEPISPPSYTVASHAESDLIFPVAGYGPQAVISFFGDKRGKTRLHRGIDIKAPRGTSVVATTDGFVERIKEGGSGGKQLYLRDGSGRLFYYAHLESWSVEEFAAVKAGEVLGTVGDSGNAKGTTPHLHFEIMLGKKKQSIDPIQFWRES